MKQIKKIILKPSELTYDIPKGGIIRYINHKKHDIYLWIEVDLDQGIEQRNFEIFTENSIIPNDFIYIGTVYMRKYKEIYHIYEHPKFP